MNSFEFTTSDEATEAARDVRRSRQCGKMIPSWLRTVFVVGALIATWWWIGVRNEVKQEDSIDQPMPLSEEDKLGDTTFTATDTASNVDTNVDDSESLPILGNCRDLYDCQTDRFGHEMPLYAGQAICNEQFRFGLTKEGIFQWNDCDMNEKKIIVVHPDAHAFVMAETGSLRLENDKQEILWQKDPTLEIIPTRECLHHPLLDCPYLHLHKSGDVVLNSITRDGQWKDRKIQHCFDELFH